MHTIIFVNEKFYGVEYLKLTTGNNIIKVSSTVINSGYNSPYKLNYELLLDESWKIKECCIEIDCENSTSLYLSTNGDGYWFDENNNEIYELTGAIDIDISCTPFTNSLPINRIDWELNHPKDFEMAYISVPDLSYKKMKQTYELISDESTKKVFKYKTEKKEVSIEVDSMGTVVNYPNRFSKVY